MKKITFLFALIMCVSCVKTPSDPGTPPPSDSKKGFNWSTVTSKSITLSETSDLFNEAGDTVAFNLNPGSYNIPTGNYTVLSARSSEETKASDREKQISFPSANSYATLMAEDLFPHKGDYDMNDVVVGFRIDYVMDPKYNQGNQASTSIKTIKINIQPRAVGSLARLVGMAVRFSGMDVQVKNASVNPQKNWLPLFAVTNKGLEEGSDVVVPLTGDLRSYFKTSSEGMINTFNNLDYYEGEDFKAQIHLGKNIELNDMTLFGDYDPCKVNMDLFVVFETRGKEIHLKGQQPSSKFDTALFGTTLTDFVTPDNYVWMVVVDKSIPYPIEMTSIEAAYPSFTTWVENNGKGFTAWYDQYDPAKVYKRVQ